MAKPNTLASDLTNRIRGHFESEGAEEIVRRSEQLILRSTREASPLESTHADGSILMHPRAKHVPLDAYLASALSQLTSVEKELVVHLSDIVSLVCRAANIELYEPRKKTDPVHNADVPDTEVFTIDRGRVLSSDLLIHLCHFASTGSGEELSFAYDALVPIILIAPGDQRVSRMITGIPSVKIEIRYREPEELRSMLLERLWEIRPFLEQRRLAMNDLSTNVVGAKIKELRQDASLSREEFAARVGLTSQGLADIEDNVDSVSNPSLTKLRWIATALKTTVAELVEPDYHEAMLASIQSLMSEKVESAVAARFVGLSDKDKRALLRRLLAKLSNELEERWHGL
jgi:transcriptional regulator with XRE-family HTH domain